VRSAGVGLRQQDKQGTKSQYSDVGAQERKFRAPQELKAKAGA